MQLEDYLKAVKTNYSEDDIADWLDDRIPEYIDEHWEDDYDDVFEWYLDYGCGEAEDDITNSLIEEFDVPDDLQMDFTDGLREIYPALLY